MSHTCIPLAHVLQELPLDSGKRIMRALRRQVRIECVQRQTSGGASYTLIGHLDTANVQTSQHRDIAPALVDELMTLLAPLIELPPADFPHRSGAVAAPISAPVFRRPVATLPDQEQ